MRIYTSYFANIKNLPDDVVAVAICAHTPKGYQGLHYPRLAPSIDLLYHYKVNGDEVAYTKEYNEYLQYLDIQKVVADLEHISGGYNVALICYEKPEDFCHRHLVADWLTKNGYPTEELRR